MEDDMPTVGRTLKPHHDVEAVVHIRIEIQQNVLLVMVRESIPHQPLVVLSQIG